MKTHEYLMRVYHHNLRIFGTVRVQAADYAEAIVEAQKQIGMTDMVTGGKLFIKNAGEPTLAPDAGEPSVNSH